MADTANITLKGESEAINFIDEALRGDIAYEELSTTVSKAGGYVAGDHLIYLGQYYEVVADIAQGGTIVTSGADQNVEEREVGDEIKKNKTQVVAQMQTLTSALTNNVNVNGSKNVLFANVYKMKTYVGNSYGTWSSNGNTHTYVYNGITWTLNCDDEGNVLSYSASGTANTDSGYDGGASPLFLVYQNTAESFALFDTIKDGGFIGKGRATDNPMFMLLWYNNNAFLGSIVYMNETTPLTPPSGANNVQIRLYVAKNKTASSGTYYPMLCLKSDYDLDPTYVPPSKTNLQLTQDSVTWDNLSEVGAVNLLDITGTTSVSHGITFTVNDGTINVTGDGDAGGTNPYLVANPGFTLPKGTYKLSGCPSGQSLQTAWLFLRTLSGEQIGNDIGNGLVFTVTDETVVYQLRVYAYNRASDLNFTFYPMIAPVSYNGQYVPYAKTNIQLTKDSVTWDNLSEVGAVNACILETWNSNSSNVRSQNGVTGTITNGTVVFDSAGSASTDAIYWQTTKFMLKKGTYKYRVKGFTNSGLTLTKILKYSDSSSIIILETTDEGIFTLSSDTEVALMFTDRVGSKTFNNVALTPMICSVAYNGGDVPYAKTNQQLTEDTTGLLDNMMDNGAVNYLYIANGSASINQVDFNVDSDNIVTLSGTASSSGARYFIIGTGYSYSSAANFKPGIYRFKGTPKTTPDNNVYMEAGCYNSTGNVVGNNGEFVRIRANQTKIFEVPENSKVVVLIWIPASVNASGLVFKPMLSDPSLNLSYDDYAPYAKSNRKLTEDTASAIANVPNGAINLAKPVSARTTTVSDVEFVIDSEGKVTANGTASANIRFDMAEVTLKAGRTYKICEPSSLQARRPLNPEGCRCYARIKSSGVWVLQNNGWKNSYTPSSDVVVSVGIAMQSGNQVTDEIFAPMLVLDGTDVGDTFYPYAMTNRELTDLSTKIDIAGKPKQEVHRFAGGSTTTTITVPLDKLSSYAQGSLHIRAASRDSEAHITFALNQGNTSVSLSEIKNYGAVTLSLDSITISGQVLTIVIGGGTAYEWYSAEYFASLSEGVKGEQPDWNFS